MILAISASALYLTATVLTLRAYRIESRIGQLVATLFSFFAFAAHLIYTIKVFWSGGGVDLAVFPVAALVTVCVGLIVLAELLLTPERARPVVIVLFPLIALTLLAAGLFHRGSLHTTSLSVGLTSHVVVSLAAYAILAYAACQAALLIWLDRAIRKHEFNAFLRTFPPLESAEVTLFNALWTGLALLTVANATGFVFFWGKLFTHASHLHVFFTFGAWMIYALLMLGHTIRGWRGNFTTKLSLAAFTLLLVGYFGTRIVIEALLT
ncbi:MAG: cytochrome c biogenesis protein CcsA [Gammaproteobacteria bacterium]|nr:cytochrome c biogenesis protein CcsA [Gammaproteobacteria bacterium]